MSLDAGTYSPFEIAYRDAGNEQSRLSAYAAPIDVSDDEGNIEEQNTLWTAFQTKVAALVLGAKVKARYFNETLFMNSQPTNGANRETKLLVQMQNTVTGRRFHFTIPTLNPDPGTVLYYVNDNAKDVVRLDAPTAITDLITATNAFVIDPTNPGDPCVVVGLEVVGRNI